MKRRISLLGSTGSIGVNVLDVVRRYPDRFEVVALAAGSNVDLLTVQVLEFQPLCISVCDLRAGSPAGTIIFDSSASRMRALTLSLH